MREAVVGLILSTLLAFSTEGVPEPNAAAADILHIHLTPGDRWEEEEQNNQQGHDYTDNRGGGKSNFQQSVETLDWG